MYANHCKLDSSEITSAASSSCVTTQTAFLPDCTAI